jgi:LAO/AO transport system kinase
MPEAAAILDRDMPPPGASVPPQPSSSVSSASAPRGQRDPAVLLEAARAGDKGAVGRLLSLVERGGEAARRVGQLTFGPSANVDQVVGITGAPGSGKSTLTDQLIGVAEAAGAPVGVLAVDPSSPFSGGAILGDRIRMQRHTLEDGVFIRSMASRGHLGGLAEAAPEAIRVLAAAGWPLVFVETVGVGQVEIEVAGAADTTVVVVTPGWGDAIQASKAGLLEVADVFVVNKADREGAPQTGRDLENMLDLNPAMGDWRPPVVMTTAATGDGVEALWDKVREHRAYLDSSGELRKRRDDRLVAEMDRLLVRLLERDVRSLAGGAHYESSRADLLARRMDPFEAAARLVREG